MTALTATLHKPSDLSSADIESWRRIQKSSPALATPFLSYGYALASERVFGSVHVAKLQRSGETVGFFAFQFRSALHRFLGVGQRLSGEMADYFGLVAGPDVSLSGRKLLELTRLRTLFFTHLDETQQAYGLPGLQPELGVRIDFPDGGKAFWEGRRKQDKKFTADTERRERRLIETHGPLRFVFRHTDCKAELQKLIAAKRAQYARTGVWDSMAKPSTRKFLEVISASDDPDCRSTLSTLYAGDEWIGSHFGLMYGDTLHYWFPVYNPQMRNFGPGRLLIKAIIDASAEIGVARIDRGSGDSQAKLDFETSRHQFLRGTWSRPGLVSLGHRATLSAKWRLERFREKAQTETSA